MSRENKPYQRKNYFIQKGFQTNMIIKFVSLLIVMAVTSSGILYVFAGNTLEMSYYEAHSSIKSMWDILGPTVLATNLLSLAVISVATVYVIMFLSHKISGPLYKLEKNINEISEGNLNLHAHFRDGDQIQTVGIALGNMLEKLSRKINAITVASNELAAVENKLLSLKNNTSVAGKDIEAIYDQLTKTTKDLSNELKFFQLKR